MKKAFFLFISAVLCVAVMLSCSKSNTSDEPEVAADPNLPEGYPAIAATQDAITLVFHIAQGADAARLNLTGTYLAATGEGMEQMSGKGIAMTQARTKGWYYAVVYPTESNGISALPAWEYDEYINYVDISAATFYPKAFKGQTSADIDGKIEVYFAANDANLKSALGQVIYLDNIEPTKRCHATFRASITGIADGYEPYLMRWDLADYPHQGQKMTPADDGTYLWTGDFMPLDEGQFCWTITLMNAQQDIIKSSKKADKFTESFEF